MSAGKAERKNERWPVSAVLLAAGTSSRMGNQNKLLLPWQGEPLVRRVAGRFAALPFQEVLVVTGYQAEAVEKALAGLPVRLVHNPRFQEGMASSIRAGVAAADPGARGLLISPTDLPFLSEEVIRRLVGAFLTHDCHKIVYPVTPEGQRNPVIFPAGFRKELQHLRGDMGARGVVASSKPGVVEVPFEEVRPFQDVDSREGFAALSGKP